MRKHQSEFVRRDRASRERYVRLYDPHPGQRFQFRGCPGQVYLRHPRTGTIMRLSTDQRLRA